MKFTKMHGLGNDYVYVNCFEEDLPDPEQVAIAVSRRHTGIGSDGLILICPSDSADAKMRMFNADGSEAEMCGNGIRCVAKYVYDRKLAETAGQFSVPGYGTFQSSLRIETASGILTLGLETGEDDTVQRVCVNMGQPILKGPDIPVNIDNEKVIEEPIDVAKMQLLMTCVSMGNPHAIFFCEDIDSIELERIGPLIENHQLFPQRINVHFVKIASPAEFHMRTWERGSGITMACGTGACASAVAGVLAGKCQPMVTAHLPGGELELNWCADDNCIYMTGPAVEVFSGTWQQ